MIPLRAIFSGVVGVLLSIGLVISAPASAVTLLEPTGDRWMYWFGDFDGRRTSASVYGAYGAYDYIGEGYDFDDRHAQMLLDFDTTAIAPPGQGAGSYQISAIEVRLLVNEPDQFYYDPSPDELATYTGAQPDLDAGRPIELFGVGYRSGYSRETFRENSAYASGDFEEINGVLIVKGRRNAYAMDFVGGIARDVSNNVEEDFEVNPWAVGQIPGVADEAGELVPQPLQAGSLVPYEAVMTFTIDLSNPQVLAYVQEGLDAGRLQFMVTSLAEYVYTGDQGSGGGFPSFYTKENFNHWPAGGVYLAPRLTAEVTIAESPVHRPMPFISRAPVNGFRIAFETQAGHTYQVQHSEDPGLSVVANLGSPVPGDGSVRFVDDPAGAGLSLPRRFYHILVTKDSNP
jgi:hypothetical protein